MTVDAKVARTSTTFTPVISAFMNFANLMAAFSPLSENVLISIATKILGVF
jgi:hypothetical protein